MSRSESSQIIKRFRGRLDEAGLTGKRVIAGLSGGVDSMVMLYAFKKAEQPVVAVHCNYGLRGEASDADQQFVEEICQLFAVECVSVRFDPKELKEGNTQKLAREKRYQVFEDLKRELKGDLIATAHHRDDQIETVLQRILRGSGMRAWGGMSYLEGDRLRPLLPFSKREIRMVAAKENISYREDSSNLESTYARNFIRNKWAPELHRLFPGWKENLLKLEKRAGEFEALADHLLSGLTDDKGALLQEPFLKLSADLQRIALVRWLEMSGYGGEAGADFLETVEELSGLQAGKELQAGPNCRIINDRDRFVIAEPENEPEPVSIKKELLPMKTPDGLRISMEPCPVRFPDAELMMDASKLQFPLTLENWSEGDRFKPLGMRGSQSVADHLTNRKVSPAQKWRAKVLKSFDGTIHAVIFPRNSSDSRIGTISDDSKCGRKSETVIRIRKI